MNMQGDACPPPMAGQSPAPSVLLARETPGAFCSGGSPASGGATTDWIGPVTLSATDTTNLWRTSRRTPINPWMDASRLAEWRLWVRFVEEDGEPAVLFVPFQNQGQQQGGMRSAVQQMNRQLWHALVTEASRDNPIDFQILYRYEPIETVQ